MRTSERREEGKDDGPGRVMMLITPLILVMMGDRGGKGYRGGRGDRSSRAMMAIGPPLGASGRSWGVAGCLPPKGIGVRACVVLRGDLHEFSMEKGKKV